MPRIDLAELAEQSFGISLEQLDDRRIYKLLVKLVQERSAACPLNNGKKKLYYNSAEFLIGKLLINNMIDLGIYDEVKDQLTAAGHDLNKIEEFEVEPSLGNGGLGRLAACFLDSMAAEGIAGYGNGMRYRYGLFKQEIVNGSQVEATDEWLTHGYPWEVRRQDKAVTIKFGGHVEGFEENGRTFYRTVDTQDILAVPYDIPVVGYAGETVNKLRVWAAEPVEEHFDLEAFNRGDYALADAERAEAEAISAILYPNDAGEHGRLLRLKQEYLFVSAGIYSLLDTFEKEHGANWELLPQFVAIHTNDTHPAMCGPELMRILIDEKKLEWDDAWNIVTQVVSYTNHTILPEALEKWPIGTFSKLLPRVYQIIDEISRRWHESFDTTQEGWQERLRQTAILWDGEIRMANLSVICSHSVNGVAKIHSDIIKNIVLKDFYALTPEKFNNKTNGISHRRFFAEANPTYAKLVTEAIGDGWLKDAFELEKLKEFQNDTEFLKAVGASKRANKERLAAYVKAETGLVIDPNTVFDVQVKRLHEYKRQLLNVLHIIALYQKLQDDPNAITQPHTFLFGAKAAPGYAVAKRIIRLINSLADQIDHDPICRDKLQVVFLENYRVSLAEQLMPASEVSQQISTAGKEASGTGNMKFMMNGALTVGTLDGANVEMHDLLGDENMFLFGLRADEVEQLKKEGYVPQRLYNRDPVLHRCLDALRTGFRDGVRYDDLYQRLLFGAGGSPADEYFLLADFQAYCQAEKRMAETYRDQTAWNRMSLHNIARSGVFAADRAVAEYADNIWHVPHK